MYATTKIVKIADSAAIRLHIATGPLAGRIHSKSPGGMGIDRVLMNLLVLPIRIFRMLQIPQRTTTSDLGDSRKVIRRRRRSGGPFERPRVPRIAPGGRTPQVRPQQIGYEDQHPGRLKEDTYSYDQVQ